MTQASHRHRDLSPTEGNETWLQGLHKLYRKIQTLLLVFSSKHLTFETKSTHLTEVERVGSGLFAVLSYRLLRRVYTFAANWELYAAHCTYAGTIEEPTKHRNSETLKRDRIPQTHLSEQLFRNSLSIDLSLDCFS